MLGACSLFSAYMPCLLFVKCVAALQHIMIHLHLTNGPGCLLSSGMLIIERWRGGAGAGEGGGGGRRVTGCLGEGSCLDNVPSSSPVDKVN